MALSRELDISYNTGWLLLHKIRQANIRPDGHCGDGEAYFGGSGEESKRGRGIHKTPILVTMALSPQRKAKYLARSGRGLHLVQNTHNVERAFREIKNFLDVGLMYHWNEKRGRGHIFVWVLAYLLEQEI